MVHLQAEEPQQKEHGEQGEHEIPVLFLTQVKDAATEAPWVARWVGFAGRAYQPYRCIFLISSGIVGDAEWRGGGIGVLNC